MKNFVRALIVVGLAVNLSGCVVFQIDNLDNYEVGSDLTDTPIEMQLFISPYVSVEEVDLKIKVEGTQAISLPYNPTGELIFNWERTENGFIGTADIKAPKNCKSSYVVDTERVNKSTPVKITITKRFKLAGVWWDSPPLEMNFTLLP